VEEKEKAKRQIVKRGTPLKKISGGWCQRTASEVDFIRGKRRCSDRSGGKLRKAEYRTCWRQDAGSKKQRPGRRGEKSHRFDVDRNESAGSWIEYPHVVGKGVVPPASLKGRKSLAAKCHMASSEEEEKSKGVRPYRKTEKNKIVQESPGRRRISGNCARTLLRRNIARVNKGNVMRNKILQTAWKEGNALQGKRNTVKHRNGKHVGTSWQQEKSTPS